MPVLLRVESSKLEFGMCEIGQKKELTTSLYNDSELKPVKFKFRKVANYIVYPASGRIMPKQQKNIVISFVPNQIGKNNNKRSTKKNLFKVFFLKRCFQI